MTERYGLRKGVCDIGGLKSEDVTIADYELTIKSGVQKDRYVKLRQNPFAHIDPDYAIINPQYGHEPIERLATGLWGTILCMSVLEHVKNPFEIFSKLAKLLKPGGILILSTEFSFPYHPSPDDMWRFTPDALDYLAKQARLNKLESGFRLNIHGGSGILDIHTGRPQEIQSVYIACSNGDIGNVPLRKFELPKRYDDSGNIV